MSSINPEYEPHKVLEERVKEYLIEKGFFVVQAPYHTTMPDSIVKLLGRRNSPSSLYLRGRADRIAIHRIKEIEFEWEAKTHYSQNKHDMTIEALPLAFHLAKAQWGVRCLYIYWNPFTDHEVGFWMHELPDMRVILIPRNRWDENHRLWFQGIFRHHFPGVPVSAPIIRSDGSLDPFAIIDESVFDTLPHWKELIDLELE